MAAVIEPWPASMARWSVIEPVRAGGWRPRPAGSYAGAVIQRLLFAASLCLLPALARADVAPTSETSDSDSESESASDTEAETMPPVYEPCGCRSEQLGGGWSLLLAGLGVWALRRRSARGPR